MQQYSLKKMYVAIRANFHKVQWSRFIGNNPGLLKWKLFGLAALRGLHTKDRSMNWGVIDEQQCALREGAYETIDHKFFSCEYANYIWSKILAMARYTQTRTTSHKRS